MLRSASVIILPFSTTLIFGPLAVISSTFHSPVGLRFSPEAGITS